VADVDANADLMLLADSLSAFRGDSLASGAAMHVGRYHGRLSLLRIQLGLETRFRVRALSTADLRELIR
jgi:hypothetical protein